MDSVCVDKIKMCTKCYTEYPATLEFFYADKRGKCG